MGYRRDIGIHIRSREREYYHMQNLFTHTRIDCVKVFLTFLVRLRTDL